MWKKPLRRLVRRYRWLALGIGIKRWFLLLIVGAGIGSLGVLSLATVARQLGFISQGLLDLATLHFLPDWLRVIADVLPASYVFEGMRALLFEHLFRTDLFLSAVGFNVLYLGLGIAVFLGVFRSARRRGLLINVGE